MATEETDAERSARHMAERAALVAESAAAQHDNHGASHTPGPWEACDPGDYADFDGDSRVILGDDRRIAVVHWSHDPHGGDTECDANARLIAAAPDLLAIAQRILDHGYVSEHIDEEHADHSQLVAAIAKALGQ